MGFFDFIKKKTVTENVNETRLSINELRTKVNSSLNEKENITQFGNEIKDINLTLNNVKQCIDTLSNTKEEGEFSKGLLIGINNIRRVLCNFITSGINTRNPNTVSEFNEYLNDVNKLITNAHLAFRKYSGAVNFVYKNEMAKLIEHFENLNNNLNKNIKNIKENIESIKSLRMIQELLSENDSIIIEKESINNELINNESSLEDTESVINELKNKLKKLNESNELRKALENKSRINELNAQASSLKNQSNLIISYLSKALKRFTHESSNTFIDSLINDPLKTINESETEFNKLSESLLKELKNGNIELKDKQAIKTIQALESNELITLARKNTELNNEIKKLDTNILRDKEETEKEITKSLNDKQSINSKNNELKEKIKTLQYKHKDLLERLSGKSSLTFNERVIILQ